MKKRNFSMLLLCISLFLVAGCSAWRGTEKSAEGTERAAGMENMEEMERMDEGEALTIYFFMTLPAGRATGRRNSGRLYLSSFIHTRRRVRTA